MIDDKSELISSYIKLKKKLNKNNSYIRRKEFRDNTKHLSHKIEKVFGSYINFVNEAEKNFTSKLPQSERALLSEKSKKFDDTATLEDCINDLRKVQKENPTKHITRNFYRLNGKYSDSTWSFFCGTFHEFRRQAGLELTRQQHNLERGVAKHASVDHYRKFYKQEILPFYNKYEKEHLPSKFKRMMICSDVHDIECDEFTLEVFVAECKRKQPDIIVLNGDIFDMYELSKYTQDIRQLKLKERFDFIHERLFGALRTACPDAQIDFIMGNHEFRLVKILADATPNLRVLLSDVVGLSFSKVFGLDDYKINWISKSDISAFTKADIKNELKKNYKIYFDCYAVTHEPDTRIKNSVSGTNGHHHSASFVSGACVQLGTITWVQTPAMHVKDAEYLKNFSAWNTGFLEVVINTESKEVIQKIHQTHDNWTEIDGVYYERDN